MAFPDTIILLNYHAAIGGQDPVPTPVIQRNSNEREREKNRRNGREGRNRADLSESELGFSVQTSLTTEEVATVVNTAVCCTRRGTGAATGPSIVILSLRHRVCH